MKKERFSEYQIIGILRSIESGRLVKDVCQEHGIVESTYFKWRSKYGGMEALDMKRLKFLGEENNRLKRMFADLSLESLWF